MRNFNILFIAFIYFTLMIALCTYEVKGNNNNQQQVEAALEKAKLAMQTGNYIEALEGYNIAIDLEPSNYLTLFKRATVYSALGRARNAINDYESVISLKPDFKHAKLQRASLLLKSGKVELAKSAYLDILKQDPSDQEAQLNLASADTYTQNLRAADEFVARHDFQNAINHYTIAIENAPLQEELRRKRADCYVAIGDLASAIADISRATKLINDNTGAYFRLSELYYMSGELEQALKQVRECLRLDADHKDCFPLYKKLKLLERHMTAATKNMESQNYDQAIAKIGLALAVDPSQKFFQTKLLADKCKCYLKLKNAQEAIKACSQALALDPNYISALIDKAEAHILLEQYDEAVQFYQQAKNSHPENQEIAQGLERAQRLLKQSSQRDYYKILSIPRNAEKKDIIKAYRREAMIWHPDKYDGDDKVMAEKRFIDIAAAKEVLTDDEKRKMYDEGRDPLDPEVQRQQQQQGGFNPFGQPFHFNQRGPGSGHPFNFQFHF